MYARISGRFARPEPRRRVREYVSGLVAGLERKNGWTLAEHAGALSPGGGSGCCGGRIGTSMASETMRGTMSSSTWGTATVC